MTTPFFNMTDKEKNIVKGLIRRDKQITSAFLNGCRPMLAYVTDAEFGGGYPLSEAAEEFLAYLLSDDAKALNEFLSGNSKITLYKWLRTQAKQHFEEKHRRMTIESSPKATLCKKTRNSAELQNKQRIEMNVAAMIDMVELERDRMVLERIDIDGVSYDELEKETGLSKANLYNIRKRALERLKMKARVALGDADHLCAIKCEQFAMDILGMHKPIYELSAIAKANCWLTDQGVPLEHIGKTPKLLGFAVKTKKGKIDDIVKAIDSDKQVLAIVDGGELVGNPFDEMIEDVLIGEIADHCVVVLNCDINGNEIMLYDPAFGDIPLSVSVSKFVDAWSDSHCHYIEIGKKLAN